MADADELDVVGAVDRDESCGATIESCHDQIDVIAGRANDAAFSASSHALPGRSCARQVPNISHACTLPRYGGASAIARRSFAAPYLRQYASVTSPPMLCDTTTSSRAPVFARTASIRFASWSANVSIDASGGPYEIV